MTNISGKAPITMNPAGPNQPPSTSGLSPGQERGASELAPGQAPKATAENVVSQLKGKGFEAPTSAPNTLAGQLAGALKEFQKQAGLPQTGQLGGKTNDALKNIGVAGTPAQPEAPGTPKAAKDDFERGAPSLLKNGDKQRVDLAKNSQPDTNFLDALLNKLGGDKGVTADKQGFVGGSQQTADAAKADAAKEAKKVNEADNKTGSTADAKKASKDETQQQLDRAKDSKLHVARGLKAEQTKTEEQRRKNALAGKDPTEKGILDEEADEDDDAGQGGEGKKRGKGGDANSGGHDAHGKDDAGGVGERDGNERSRGNASSGSEDDGDARRGNASLDDGSENGAGHHRVPSLSEQAFAALMKIQKDPSATNKATTYSWDVMFFKPGVYGGGQKAQDLVHLVVTSATAFDPVWQRAQANLQVMVRKLESNAPVPTVDDIVAALRQARAREGDKEAVLLGKLTRPPGRA